MLDAVNLEKQGTPSLTFVTEPFAQAARAHARIHQLPELPLIVVPSDYLDRSDEAVAEKLAPLLDEIVEKLCEGRGIEMEGEVG
ncbi:MAG: hypothetical protein JRG90_18055 [Deltaproteobacteria bacterium]|nr:hypothetical protein [Deltaproteobacteria bacterium]